MNRDAGSHAFARIEVALRDFQEGGDAAKSPPAIITRNTEEEGIALEGGRIRSAPVPASGAKIHCGRIVAVLKQVEVPVAELEKRTDHLRRNHIQFRAELGDQVSNLKTQ